MGLDFKYKVACPMCDGGMVFSNGTANLQTSHICTKCNRAFIIDWKLLKAYPADKIKKNISSH